MDTITLSLKMCNDLTRHLLYVSESSKENREEEDSITIEGNGTNNSDLPIADPVRRDGALQTDRPQDVTAPSAEHQGSSVNTQAEICEPPNQATSKSPLFNSPMVVSHTSVTKQAISKS